MHRMLASFLHRIGALPPCREAIHRADLMQFGTLTQIFVSVFWLFQFI
jgi:hypothetical protein